MPPHPRHPPPKRTALLQARVLAILRRLEDLQLEKAKCLESLNQRRKRLEALDQALEVLASRQPRTCRSPAALLVLRRAATLDAPTSASFCAGLRPVEYLSQRDGCPPTHHLQPPGALISEAEQARGQYDEFQPFNGYRYYLPTNRSGLGGLAGPRVAPGGSVVPLLSSAKSLEEQRQDLPSLPEKYAPILPASQYWLPKVIEPDDDYMSVSTLMAAANRQFLALPNISFRGFGNRAVCPPQFLRLNKRPPLAIAGANKVLDEAEELVQLEQLTADVLLGPCDYDCASDSGSSRPEREPRTVKLPISQAPETQIYLSGLCPEASALLGQGLDSEEPSDQPLEPSPQDGLRRGGTPRDEKPQSGPGRGVFAGPSPLCSLPPAILRANSLFESALRAPPAPPLNDSLSLGLDDGPAVHEKQEAAPGEASPSDGHCSARRGKSLAPARRPAETLDPEGEVPDATARMASRLFVQAATRTQLTHILRQKEMTGQFMRQCRATQERQRYQREHAGPPGTTFADLCAFLDGQQAALADVYGGRRYLSRGRALRGRPGPLSRSLFWKRGVERHLKVRERILRYLEDSPRNRIYVTLPAVVPPHSRRPDQALDELCRYSFYRLPSFDNRSHAATREMRRAAADGEELWQLRQAIAGRARPPRAPPEAPEEPAPPGVYTPLYSAGGPCGWAGAGGSPGGPEDPEDFGGAPLAVAEDDPFGYGDVPDPAQEMVGLFYSDVDFGAFSAL